MMRPQRWRTIGITSGCVTLKKPSSEVRVTACQSSSWIEGKALSRTMPALLRIGGPDSSRATAMAEPIPRLAHATTPRGFRLRFPAVCSHVLGQIHAHARPRNKPSRRWLGAAYLADKAAYALFTELQLSAHD